MRNKHIFFILSFLSLLPAWCNAQYLRINHVNSRTDFSFDLNHLYNYNIYERNRWGGGLYLQTPLHYDNRYGSDFQNSLRSTAYMAWGTGDHALKYGAEAALLFPRDVARRLAVGYRHDLEQSGGHSFNSYNIFNTIENCSYFSSRYSSIDRLWAAMDIDLPGPGFMTVMLRHSLERLLFDSQGLLYPNINPDEKLPRSGYDEIRLQLKWGSHWLFNILGGMGHHGGNGGDKAFAQIVAQYSNKLKLNDKWGTINLFAQAGNTLGSDTPVSRRFNLGGTGGSMYYFSNSFVTVRPNLFMADAFTHLSLRYSTDRPLWKNALSNPTPFLQINALWGALRHLGSLDEQGTYLLLSGESFDTGLAVTKPANELISFIAPFQGLLEPAAGIDQLVRWGAINLGIAVAWQMTPEKSLYHSDNFFNNFSVMCVAKLVTEK